MDVSNPLDFSKGMPPTLSVCNDDSLGERIQRAFPGAKVVKTLNTVNAALMVDPRALADGEHKIKLSGPAVATGKKSERLHMWVKKDPSELMEVSNSERLLKLIRKGLTFLQISTGSRITPIDQIYGCLKCGKTSENIPENSKGEQICPVCGGRVLKLEELKWVDDSPNSGSDY